MDWAQRRQRGRRDGGGHAAGLWPGGVSGQASYDPASSTVRTGLCADCLPDAVLLQACAASATLIDLPRRCHLTYEEDACEPALLRLIDRVPADLWGARLALQVRAPAAAAPGAALRWRPSLSHARLLN